MIPGMKIFDQLERRRAWEPEEQAILDAVRRVADEVIAPKAAGSTRAASFPGTNVEALNGARAQRHVRAGGLWRQRRRATSFISRW